MAGLPIPDDWTAVQDGYEVIVVTIPASNAWRALAKGALLNLADEWRWDTDTGDAAAASAQGFDIFDSIRDYVDGGTP